MKIYNPSLLSTDITGSIRLTNEATASLIGQLSSSLDDRYILSGSVSNADWDTLLNRPSNIVSESQDTSTVNFTITDGVITADLIGGVVSGSSQVIDILTSLNSYTSSTDDRLTSLETESGSVRTELNTYTSSNDGRLNNIETFSGSVNSKFDTLSTYTSSNDTTNTTQNNRLDQLSTVSGSSIGRLNNIETFSGSINTKFSTLATYTGSNDTTNTTQNSRLTSLEVATQSLDQRLDSFELVSASYARIDLDNTFSGLQTFTNINVNGTASFGFIQSTTGSSTSIGEAFIILNENTPSSNFAGIKVVDSGSTFATASFVYDGLNNNWVFQHTGSPSSGSSLAIFGPLSQGGLGTETKLTENRVPKAVTTHGHHIGDSNITDNGSTITLGSNTVVNGTIVSTGTTIISSSAQITLVGDISGTANATSITSNCIVNDDINTSAGIVYTKLNLNGSGLVSGSSQVSYTGLSNIPAGIVSGSTQIVPLLPTGTVSGSSQVQFLSVSGRPAGLVSGSSQVSYTGLSNIPAGIVSGSSQIDASSTTNWTTNVKARLNAETVISGSSQVALNSTTGTLCVNKGGTGQTSYTNGELLIGNTTGNTLTKGTLTQGTGVTVTNGTGTITIAIGQAVATSSNVQFNSIGVNTAASGTAGEIRATNEITAFYSDDRLKTRLGKIEDALNKVKQLNGYYFVENEVAKSLGYTNDNRQVGVSAQEVQSVLPEVVTTAPISDEYLTVKYDKLIPLLIEAVKEQNNIVETLINEVEELKNLLNNRG
jgi:hypothetical protein